jgi:hypothetical protein
VTVAAGLFPEECGTLPRTPVEVSQQWRATERLGYSTLAISATTVSPSTSGSRTTWYIFFSRVLEKGPEYPLSCLAELLRREDPVSQGIKELLLFSDGPSQFKNRVILGTLGFDTLAAHSLDKVVVSYGCPKHMKSPCDGLFGTLSGILQTRVSTVLETIDDLKGVYDTYFQSIAEAASHIVLNFIPPPKHELSLSALTASSCLGIVSSFCWSFTRNDARRKTRVSLRGSGTAHDTLTGITLRNHGHSGSRCDKETTTFPVLDTSMPVPAVVEVMEVEQFIGEVKDMHGWRCSFRKQDHVGSSEAATRRRAHLGRLALAARPPAAKQPEARRHRPRALVISSSLLKQGKAIARARADRLALKLAGSSGHAATAGPIGEAPIAAAALGIPDLSCLDLFFDGEEDACK